MNQPPNPQNKKDLPWQFWIGLGGFIAFFAILTVFGVLDFSPQPGYQKGIKVVFMGLHEIFGPAGPVGAMLLVSAFFIWTGLGLKKKQNKL